MADLSFTEVEEILRLVQRIEGNDVTLTWGDLSVRVQRGDNTVVAASEAPASTEVPEQPAGVPAPAGQSAPAAEVPEGWVAVDAPMVGTFYRAPSPQVPPFVELGDDVKAGDTVGLVEVMKLFTELTCDIAGKVVRIDADNGALVEYGQPLLWIEPT